VRMEHTWRQARRGTQGENGAHLAPGSTEEHEATRGAAARAERPRPPVRTLTLAEAATTTVSLEPTSGSSRRPTSSTGARKKKFPAEVPVLLFLVFYRRKRILSPAFGYRENPAIIVLCPMSSLCYISISLNLLLEILSLLPAEPFQQLNRRVFICVGMSRCCT